MNDLGPFCSHCGGDRGPREPSDSDGLGCLENVYHSENTGQLVRVTLGKAHTLYTYRWTGSRSLRRGEKVIVPVSDPDPDSSAEALCTATVAAFGSAFTGPIKDIVRKQHPWEQDR